MPGLGEATPVQRIPGKSIREQNFFQGLTRCEPHQAGFSEDWLCAIFSNLTEELYSALQAAWLSMMIIQRERMLMAEDSMHNRLYRATASVLGALNHQARVLFPPPLVRSSSFVRSAPKLRHPPLH